MPDVEYHNIHSLPLQLFQEASNFPLEQLPALLERELVGKREEARDIWPYNHLVVDEGQDFSHDILEALMGVTAGHIYIFYDRHQMVHFKELPKWLEQIDCRMVLNKNCRNTVEIARTAVSVLDEKPLVTLNTVRGEEPQVIFSANISAVENKIRQIVEEALREKAMDIKDIVVLSVQGEGQSILKGRRLLRTMPVTSKYDEYGLLFTTVRKFKGLEAKVVILVDVSDATFRTEECRRLFYVGSSRARHELYIIMNPGIQPRNIVEAIALKQKIPPTIKGVNRLLYAKAIEESL